MSDLPEVIDFQGTEWVRLDVVRERIEWRRIERDDARDLARALLDRAMELDHTAERWRESLVKKWPWLEARK